MVTTPAAIFVQILGDMFFYVIFAMEEEEKWRDFLIEHAGDYGEEICMHFDEFDAVGMGSFSFPLIEEKNKKLAQRLSKARGCQTVNARSEVVIKNIEVLTHCEEYPETSLEWLETRCNECRRRQWDDVCLACPNRRRLLDESSQHLVENQLPLSF